MELEEIVMFCVKKLAKYLKQIPIEEFSDILSKYYVSVFRSADKEFGNLLQIHTFDEICHTIAYQIVERRIKDKLYGEFIN
jgi:hypothetical protein